MNCKICNSLSNKKLTSFIFEKTFLIDYYECVNCNFIQTTEPTWLDRAYSNVIAPLDIGLLERNRIFCNLTEKLLLTFYPETKTFVDFGAGYGVFVRMMRDKGFDFKWYDLYSENIFAKNFEETNLDKKINVITAFEVMEHLPNPLQQIDKLILNSDVFIFSTDITHLQQPNFEDWWYRAPYSGQHVAFYTLKNLKIIANKYNKNLYTDETGYHIFSTKKLNQNEVIKFFKPKTTLIQKLGLKLSNIGIKKIKYKTTLLQKDHTYLTSLYIK